MEPTAEIPEKVVKPTSSSSNSSSSTRGECAGCCALPSPRGGRGAGSTYGNAPVDASLYAAFGSTLTGYQVKKSSCISKKLSLSAVL